MTTHLGTFIPLQTQNLGWGSNGMTPNTNWGLTGLTSNTNWGLTGLTPNTNWGLTGLTPSTNWGLTGWNPNTTWNQTALLNTLSGWNPSSAWGQNTILGHNHPHNPGHSPLLVTPGIGLPFGNGMGEIAHGLTQQGTTVAFVPNHTQMTAPTLVGLPTTALVGLTNQWQGGNQTLGGIGGIAGHTGLGGLGGIGGIAGHTGLGGLGGIGGQTHAFATELSENNHEYVVAFDVPGIDIQDLDISLSGNTILINGIRKGSHESATLAYSEIARGSISRAIGVPFDVSPSKAINTSLENGVLKIRIAKETQSEKKSLARKVKIS